MAEAPILIAALVIAGIWGAYLFPSLFGGRKDAPLNSTEEFDRWTHLMADVQRRSGGGRGSRQVTARDVIRSRRRRTLVVLGTLAVATLAVAVLQRSLNWLLVHLAIDAVAVWYMAMLSQLRARRRPPVQDLGVPEAPPRSDGGNVRLIAGG